MCPVGLFLVNCVICLLSINPKATAVQQINRGREMNYSSFYTVLQETFGEPGISKTKLLSLIPSTSPRD